MNEKIIVGDTVYYEYSHHTHIVIYIENYFFLKRYILADKEYPKELKRANRSEITKLNQQKT